MTGEKASILVISPLQALMVDQVNKLNDIGIKAVFLGEAQPDKTIVDQVMAGKHIEQVGYIANDWDIITQVFLAIIIL